MIAAKAAPRHHAAHAASDTIAVPPIRYLAIMPLIIMIGGAIVLLAVASLVRRPLRVRVATVATVVISAGRARRRALAVERRHGPRRRTPTSPTPS